MTMGLLHNTPLLVALFSVIFAQFVKIPILFVFTRKLEWGMLTSTGGMPSSHSASVTGLATAMAFEYGLDSPFFAISTMLAVIVMYDAKGIRYQAGQHAAILNQLRLDFYTLIKDIKEWPSKNEEEKAKELKTLLGHKPSEVFFGALTGILIATITYTVFL